MNFGPITDQLYLYGFQLCRKTPIKTKKGYWAYSARNEICIHSETDETIGLPLKRLSNTPFTDWYSFTNKLLKIRHRLTFGVVRFLWGVQLNCGLPLVLMKLRARKYMGLCKRISYVARVKKERDLLGINIAQGPVCQLMLYIKKGLGKRFAWKVYARD